MSEERGGLHHVTAIARDGRRNLDFYGGTLGLGVVKRTVNFDAPFTWHLYYGDAAGAPGTVLTFFVRPDSPDGAVGAGQAAEVAFAVAEGSLARWEDRLRAHGAAVEGIERRFGDERLTFRDPDGLPLALVAEPGSAAEGIRGLYGVTLWEPRPDPTAEVLRELLEYRDDGRDGEMRRLRAGRDVPGRIVDLLERPAAGGAVQGAGTVHHVAFRARDDAVQAGLRESAAARGLDPTEVRDRKYFRSIYFREPGGVLFEVATEAPGFAVDEPPDALGRALSLPDWLEPRRAEIEARLPPLAP